MKCKRGHKLLALHRERIERELAGLLPQEGGERSQLEQQLADDTENLREEHLDAGSAKRLGVCSPRRALQPRGPAAIPDQGSLTTTSAPLMSAQVQRRR
jgi:hypothetical protein